MPAPSLQHIRPRAKLVKAEYGRGWYHDAAVEEEQTAKLVRPLFTDRV